MDRLTRTTPGNIVTGTTIADTRGRIASIANQLGTFTPDEVQG